MKTALPRRVAGLSALAVAALLSAPGDAAAQAGSGVTIYGLFDAAMRQANNANASRASLRTMEDGIMTGSRLGLRGREDLGGGLSAVFTLESGFDPSTGLSLQSTPTADYGQAQSTTRFWGREMHAGLRTPWGGFTVGRNYTLAHAMAARFQPQGNPNSTAHSLFSSHHIARQDNIVRADTRLGGVDLLAAYTFGEQAGSRANSAWAAGAGYAQGALALGAYVQVMKNLAGNETRKVVGLGGNYRFGPAFHLFGGAMQRTSKASPQENRAWTLGANIVVAERSTLSLAHYSDDQSGSAALDGRRRVSWATVNYLFSRRTDVYAVVDTNVVEGGYARPAFMGTKGSQTGLVLGVRHRF
jgi:predicted porin